MDEIFSKDIHPELRPLVQEFMLKCKYPFEMRKSGRWVIVQENETGVQYSQGVSFYDPNAETMQYAGVLKWQHGDFGKPPKFRVLTRYLLNPRYRDSERQKSVDTQDPKRALKEMLTHIKPFALTEIASSHQNSVETNIHKWKYTASHKMSEYFNLANGVIAREVLHLASKGVEFSTPEFKAIVAEGIPAYEEYHRRNTAKLRKHFVKFERNGTITVLSPDGQSSFTAFEKLPEFAQEAIGILKMMRTDSQPNPAIEGVGTCVGENMYWVIEHERDK